MTRSPNAEILAQLLQRAGFTSFLELQRRAQVPELQLHRIAQGLIANVPLRYLLPLAQALGLTLDQLWNTFQGHSAIADLSPQPQIPPPPSPQESEQQQRQFQADTLRAIESWLIQWPAAAHAAQNQDQFPAKTLLLLVRPLEKLLQGWQVETLGQVGEEVDYDPALHTPSDPQQIIGVGDRVMVKNPGYRHQGALLHRARVSRTGTH